MSADPADATPSGETASVNDPVEAPRPLLSPAAQRALAEAEARRKARDAEATARPPEVDGRKGPDPVRYGDWESGGIASDF